MAKSKASLDTVQKQRRQVRSVAPYPVNADRALWGEEALRVFMKRTGLEEVDGFDTGLVDLLCDLHHLSDGLNLDFTDLLRQADNHYRCEVDPNDDETPGDELTLEVYGTIREQIAWA